jgi:DNA-directed RNA polymerase subunit RPC12/RpoP
MSQPSTILERPLPVCPVCGERMLLVRSVPKLGRLPELVSYRCATCNHVQTEAVEPGAQDAQDARP